jgi:hypothetical protein
MFDPSIGRFFEEDPDLFAAGDADLYRYCENDPTNATDPTGLEPRLAGVVEDPRKKPKSSPKPSTQMTEPDGAVERFFANPDVKDQFAIDRPLGRGAMHDYRTRIEFSGAQSFALRLRVRRDLLNAMDDVSKANYALEHYWDEIQAFYPDTIQMKPLFKDNNRQFYLEKTKAVMHYARNDETHICIDIDDEDREDQARGYVLAPFRRSIHLLRTAPAMHPRGSVESNKPDAQAKALGFHLRLRVRLVGSAALVAQWSITPIGLKQPDSDLVETLYHEMARYVAKIDGPNQKGSDMHTTSDVNVWDDVVGSLSADFDKLKAEHERKQKK